MTCPAPAWSSARASETGGPAAATTLRRVEHLIRVAEEVQAALEDERAVVALETTLVAHGFPAPTGVGVGLASETAVRAAGAVPATIEAQSIPTDALACACVPSESTGGLPAGTLAPPFWM